jgi:hypothetical protein
LLKKKISCRGGAGMLDRKGEKLYENERMCKSMKKGKKSMKKGKKV